MHYRVIFNAGEGDLLSFNQFLGNNDELFEVGEST